MKKVHNCPLTRLVRLREELSCFPPISPLHRPTSLTEETLGPFLSLSFSHLDKGTSLSLSPLFSLLCTPSKPNLLINSFLPILSRFSTTLFSSFFKEIDPDLFLQRLYLLNLSNNEELKTDFSNFVNSSCFESSD